MPSPTAPTTNIRFRPVGDDTEQRLLYKICAILATGAGLGGVDWISDTSAHTGDWLIFHAVSDSVITAITYKSGTSGGTGAGQTVKAGDRIYGSITSITLASGSGELYRPGI